MYDILGGFKAHFFEGQNMEKNIKIFNIFFIFTPNLSCLTLQ